MKPHENCLHHPERPVHLRGVCRLCYFRFQREVKARLYTWEELENDGWINPRKRPGFWKELPEPPQGA